VDSCPPRRKRRKKKRKKRRGKLKWIRDVAGCEWLGGISFYLKPPTYINYHRTSFY
jgi:hypothetical protein